MKIKGATLVESLVAMVLIVLSLGFATLIYSNVLGSDHQMNEQKAVLILNKYAFEIKNEKQFIDDYLKFENYFIEKTIEKHPYTEDLYFLKLSLINMNKKYIYTRRELILLR